VELQEEIIAGRPPLAGCTLHAEQDTTDSGLPNRSNQTIEQPTHESASLSNRVGSLCNFPWLCIKEGSHLFKGGILRIFERYLGLILIVISSSIISNKEQPLF
jgi:hypothetical protein